MSKDEHEDEQAEQVEQAEQDEEDEEAIRRREVLEQLRARQALFHEPPTSLP